MEEAKTKKGHYWMLELLICAAVYFVGSIILSVVQVPLFLTYLMSNKQYMAFIQQGKLDIESSMRMVNDVMSNMPEWMSVGILASSGVLILVYIIYCVNFEKRKIGTMGFQKNNVWKNYAIGLGIGAAVFSLAYALCVVLGAVEIEGIAVDFSEKYLFAYLFAYVLQGMAEEVIFRGQLFVALTRRYSVRFSIFVSSLFFAFMQSFNDGVSELAYVNVFLYAVFSCLLFLKFQNIWVPAAAHTMWNFVQGNIFGISVSGTVKQNSLFQSILDSDKLRINGGEFGMEGGIAVSVILVIAIAVLYYVIKKEGLVVKMPTKTFDDAYRNMPNSENSTPKQPQNDPNIIIRPEADPVIFEEQLKKPQPQEKKEEKIVKTGFDENYFS